MSTNTSHSNTKNYVGQIGVGITIDCGQAINDAITYKFEVRKPDGTLAVWQPTIISETALEYTTVDGDFSVAGLYAIQPYLVLPNGFDGRADTVFFRIYGYFDQDSI